jgi:hypothetical protein
MRSRPTTASGIPRLFRIQPDQMRAYSRYRSPLGLSGHVRIPSEAQKTV